MVVRKELPDCDIILDCKDQDIVAGVIRTILDAGMPEGNYKISDSMRCNDYPYLFWEKSRGILNRVKNVNRMGSIRTESPQVFINYLLEETIHELWI